MRKHLQNVFSTVTQFFYFINTRISASRAERRFEHRRSVVQYVFPVRDHKRLMRFGLTGRQLYLIGTSGRRKNRAEIFRYFTYILFGQTVIFLAAPIFNSFADPDERTDPHEAAYMATMFATACVIFALTSLAYEISVNARRNRGGALAALSVETVQTLESLYQYRPRRSGLAQGGAASSATLEKWRRTVRENCWKITFWSADITGRPRGDYAHESVSSFPRILLWAMEKPDYERVKIATMCLAKFVDLIDKNSLDFTLDEASDTNRQVPEMKKPSVLIRLRRNLSVTKISATVAIFAGTATILTFFKVPADGLFP